MSTFWIYLIECVETGQVYIGQTSKPSPFWRWSYHINSLQNRYIKNHLFQKAWDEYPDLKYWRFQALERVEGGKINTNHRETEIMLKIPTDKRLNIISGITLNQREQMYKLLEEGVKGYIIAEKVGVSTATVSNAKKELFNI